MVFRRSTAWPSHLVLLCYGLNEGRLLKAYSIEPWCGREDRPGRVCKSLQSEGFAGRSRIEGVVVSVGS
jgi:hypothetical protein